MHDETNQVMARMLAAMRPPAFPMALGVLYCDPEPTYDASVKAQIDEAKAAAPSNDINALLRRGYTWTVSD